MCSMLTHSVCAHSHRKKEKERKREKDGRMRHEERSSVCTRRKPVGNRASRNADADKGNPYDRLWYGYLWAVLLVRWKNGRFRRWEPWARPDGDPANFSPRRIFFPLLSFFHWTIPELPIHGAGSEGDAVKWRPRDPAIRTCNCR